METSNEQLKTLALKILEDSFVLSLGTVDEDGVWVSDLTYIYDENFNLYWLSVPHVRHSQALENNPRVACTITASWVTKKERALQIQGIAERAVDVPFEYEKRIETKRGLPAPTVPGEILAKGHVWYVIKPTKIELIQSELFGFKKQMVVL